MCDGYPAFYDAFVGNGIDTTAHECVRNAIENAPEVVNTAKRPVKAAHSPLKAVCALFARLRGF